MSMSEDEVQRIRRVYADRDEAGRQALYAWHRAEVQLARAQFARTAASLIARALGPDLTATLVLDVGCGTGGFLRHLIEWGCAPQNLAGTEFLPERLEKANAMSAASVTWHLGGLSTLSRVGFDLVAASTVFSSILDPAARQALATEMLAKTRPGGWILVFDFRYNNPRNPDVRRVTRGELLRYFAPERSLYRTLLLAPPLARRLAPISTLLCDVITSLLPFTRSHFVLLMQKKA
jgi:SAM-dependent methyltransferase